MYSNPQFAMFTNKNYELPQSPNFSYKTYTVYQSPLFSNKHCAFPNPLISAKRHAFPQSPNFSSNNSTICYFLLKKLCNSSTSPISLTKRKCSSCNSYPLLEHYAIPPSHIHSHKTMQFLHLAPSSTNTMQLRENVVHYNSYSLRNI